MEEEVAFGLLVGARLELRPLPLQEPRQNGAERLALLLAFLEFLAGDIVTESDGGKNVLRGSSSPAQRQCVDRTERHPSMLGADLVLHDERARTAGAHAHAKTR